MGIKHLKQQGVSLVELILAIVIVSIALGALMQNWSEQIRHSSDPLLQRKSLKLAQLYGDEILSKRFDESTPLGGGSTNTISCPASDGRDTGESTRDDFDDVDDYHSLSDSPPKDSNGNTLSNYSAYQVDVSISCISDQFGIATNNQVKRIDINVTTAVTDNSFTLSIYKANF